MNSQNVNNRGTILRVMSYNVENLFDTIDDRTVDDDEFTPEGRMQWNYTRYHIKLQHISRVIARAGEWEWPQIVGLMEIENSIVLEDLIYHTPLNGIGYKYNVSHGLDRRGIHIGLLYKDDTIELLDSKEYTVKFTDATEKLSRNIFYNKLKLRKTGDTIDLFLCHFPSRREGVNQSEFFRCDAARLLREKCDSIYSENKDSKVIIMGDFNEEPYSKAIKRVLKSYSLSDSISLTNSLNLYNLFGNFNKKSPPGSYFYRGRWNQLDQIIVSGNLLDINSSIHYKSGSAHTYTSEYLTKKGRFSNYRVPFRTYLGDFYVGGYSDHLPVLADFIIK